MSQFAVMFNQGSGCDYTCACGQRFEFLPDSIQTMEDAVKHVTGGDSGDCDDIRQAAYYGGVDHFDGIMILKLEDWHSIDIKAIQKGRDEVQAQADAAEEEAEARKKFAELQNRFGYDQDRPGLEE